MSQYAHLSRVDTESQVVISKTEVHSSYRNSACQALAIETFY